MPHSQLGGGQGSQFQPAAFHRGPLNAGQGLHNQHARRVDFRKGPGVGVSAAGDVRQHLRLALRHSGMQLLRPVHRSRHPGRYRPGLLRYPPSAHQGAIRHLVDQDRKQVQRGAADTRRKILGRVDGNGGGPGQAAHGRPDRRGEGGAETGVGAFEAQASGDPGSGEHISGSAEQSELVGRQQPLFLRHAADAGPSSA